MRNAKLLYATFPTGDEALKWAATLPAASDRAVEVRPVIKVEAPR